MKFLVYEEEQLNYPFTKNKGADQSCKIQVSYKTPKTKISVAVAYSSISQPHGAKPISMLIVQAMVHVFDLIGNYFLLTSLLAQIHVVYRA